MEWKTAISTVEDGKELIRGYDLRELIAKKTFVEVVWLVLRGELPEQTQTRMLDALLSACVDHGIGVSSAMTARTVVSTGNSLHTALAAGILSLGTLHGSAVEDAAVFFETHVGTDAPSLVQSLRAQHVRIPGFGHKILNHDPRSDALFGVARTTGWYGKHCAFALAIAETLAAMIPKPLPVNVDGAMAAILLDMGFDARMTKGFFILGRVPGLVAHIYEEMTSKGGLRRLREDEAHYIGPSERALPS
jgi:citryl-CoA lyase